MRAFKYGPFREWVLALRLALADGTVIKVGEPLRKNRAGYDLVSLVVGSEGTLGVVTEAWLRIRPLPKHEEVTLAIYPKDIFAVGEIVKVVRKSGLEPDLMEYMDAFVVRSVNKQIEPIYWEGEGGVVLVRGDNSTLSEVERLSSPFLARSEVVDGEVGRKMLNGRSLVAIAVKSEIGNIYAEDIVVPPSKLSEAILQIKRIEVENDTKIPVAGHVGDGNLHPMLREADLVSKPELFDEVGGVALRLGGSISGEHGIGIQKVNLLRSQLLNRNGEVVVKLMKEIKGLFDPKDTLNQGKFVDPL
ncbi:hypothetical protein HS1genome_0425 [Sulfodiicoccus acidiphilus]|nr:FAD-linked oxidase C-terminal domain-containing protein [Sulfodiicoccus acidiphilus]BBD72036.1 hypothetical protein HS1genome_0425 [Sulfodiicoccus acidiphilus]